MFIKIKDSSDANNDIRWIVNTEGMKMWSINGFTAKGYRVRSDGSVDQDSRMNFQWTESGVSFESYDDLEQAKLACFEEMGYKHVTVNDMKPGDVFSVMIDGVETKCNKFEYCASTYILVMDGVEGGRVNPRYIVHNTPVIKKYKLEEVQK